MRKPFAYLAWDKVQMADIDFLLSMPIKFNTRGSKTAYTRQLTMKYGYIRHKIFNVKL
jgi:hypothetical protein